jgi:hypothetical protein
MMVPGPERSARGTVSSSNFVRWGGLAAVAGGALWMAVFALFASRPSGPGSAPPYRSFEGLYVPCLVSTVLIVAGLVALHVHLRGTYGGLGTAGFVLALVGAALLVLVVGGAPFLLSRAGALGLLLGSALMGAAALRASARLRLGGAALVVGSLAFFLLDTEGWRVWFALPYGGAWVLVGYLLRSGGAGAPPRPTRVG